MIKHTRSFDTKRKFFFSAVAARCWADMMSRYGWSVIFESTGSESVWAVASRLREHAGYAR